MAVNLSTGEVIETIEDFLAGTGGDLDWDDFTSIRVRDQRLDSLRIECAELPTKYPPAKAGHYCNEEGLNRLKEIVAELKADQNEKNPRS
jgi:hypothetical protein